MANGWLAGLGKVLDAGVAYVQHTAFANKALNAPADLQQQLLAEYTRGLSGASFTGLKATLGMLIANETQATRKAGLQQPGAGPPRLRRHRRPYRLRPTNPATSSATWR
jgi:hypothetical protein